MRNLLDGTVEVTAGGAEAAVAALVAWLGHGLPPARVSGIDVVELPAAELPAAGFTVR